MALAAAVRARAMAAGKARARPSSPIQYSKRSPRM
jgi:hypothetical protein